MADHRRRSASGRRRRASGWCCSFSDPPASPDPRLSSFKSPPVKNFPAGFFSSSASPAKLGRSIIDTRRILSPGRVSPIDSDDPPPPLASLPEAVSPSDPTPPGTDPAPEIPPTYADIRDRERGSMDLRLRVKGKGGGILVLEMDSGILCENSEIFQMMVTEPSRKTGFGEEAWREVDAGEVDDLVVFRETIEMMYVEEEDLMRWLSRAGVSRSIDMLEVSCKIMFDKGVVSCLNYIEAVPWNEHEEEKLKTLFARCTFDEALTQDILARLHPGSPSGSENLAVQLIQSIANGANGNARKELQSLATGLLSKSSVYEKDPAGLNKERLYSICHSCLVLLVDLFEEASYSTPANRGNASKETKPLVERVSKQVENINWLLEILIDRHMAGDFVCLWARQKELIAMHQRASPMVRYELSRISASVFVAMGKGKVRCPGDVRCAVMEAWFGPMLTDFGWLQRCSKGMDIRVLEEGLGQALLTLPLKHQQSLFEEWFRCFGAKGTECPNLSKAFQVWWRRSFARTTQGRS